MIYSIITALAVNALKNLPDFTPWQKRGIAILVSGVLAVVSLWYAKSLDLADLSRTWLVTFLVASGIYTAILRPATEAAAGNPQS